ncbi:oligosaccharide flippase family protein [Phocoenobacter skyensis]|uniref:Oligosaccharide flippase family protein n=1 Tax=Phocoenobacter skyensis TaxID=97481 RepID=A0A1H7WGK0_9PAST|nr:oligosaccharide flippase family protein [Pasteurella skyensis]MDP8079224.1 oligosaccharide flippase family protein [Pasteurella skyensis]MDP8085166.1 oligosaccharide flippase family protein [Pasteurella skyensis]MDP8185083.1 oligosaccharide flippase family protein [Pasteurella skyensis]QLB22231.1 polysaccharide biosynthesis protein [Pasteurella skyensis]SEM20641.1 polysaccharide transporter, PST family [Pasteurella skyensis]
MQRIKSIFANKDYKSLIENLLSLGFLQFANLLLPLLVLPYMIKTVGFDYYGQIVVSASLIKYFHSLTLYSFGITATRDIAIHKHSKSKLNFIFSQVMITKLIFLLVALILITLIALFVPVFSTYKTIIFLSMLVLIGNVLFPDWYFQGIEKMKYITMINVFIKVFFTLFIFLFIKEREDYWIYPLVNSLGYIFAGVLALYVVFVRHRIQLLKLKPIQIKTTITNNFPIFVNEFVPVLYNNTSSLLLGVFVSSASAGIYDALKKIVDLAIMLLNVISKVFFPFLNRKKDFFSKYRKMFFLLVFVIIAFILMFSQQMFAYFRIVNENAFSLLFILLFGIVGSAFYLIYAVNYLIVHRFDNLVMKNTLYVSLLSFVISFPLVYFLELLGAVISITISRVALGTMMYITYLKVKNYE